MKKAVTLALVVLYVFALVRPALPLIEYFIQYNEFQIRCVNKEKPQMHCNGQCILMQKLKALNVSVDTTSPPLPVKINFEDYPVALIGTSKSTPDLIKSQHVLTYPMSTTKISTGWHLNIFHPPQA